MAVSASPRYRLIMSQADDVAPSLGDIEELARRAFDRIPPRMRTKAANVVICIDEFPDDDVVNDMGLASPFDILGLYRGVSIDQKSYFEASSEPDMVFLYRRPILDYWCEGSDTLAAVVRHVLIHEIGHHLGFSDADMASIEAEVAG